MATVIRLKRCGRTHAPYYRVVVTDSRGRTVGRVIDEIGVYQPCARPQPNIEIDRQKALDWLSKGARPSETVRSVLTKNGIIAEACAAARTKPAAAAGTAAVSEG